jgi:hypothetical protein
MDRRGQTEEAARGEETPDRWDRPGSGRTEGERPWAAARVRGKLARAGPGRRCGPGGEERREARAEGELDRGTAHAGRGEKRRGPKGGGELGRAKGKVGLPSLIPSPFPFLFSLL